MPVTDERQLDRRTDDRVDQLARRVAWRMSGDAPMSTGCFESRPGAFRFTPINRGFQRAVGLCARGALCQDQGQFCRHWEPADSTLFCCIPGTFQRLDASWKSSSPLTMLRAATTIRPGIGRGTSIEIPNARAAHFSIVWVFSISAGAATRAPRVFTSRWIAARWIAELLRHHFAFYPVHAQTISPVYEQYLVNPRPGEIHELQIRHDVRFNEDVPFWIIFAIQFYRVLSLRIHCGLRSLPHYLPKNCLKIATHVPHSAAANLGALYS